MKIFAVILVSCAMTFYQNGKALREEGKQEEAMQAFIEAAHSGTEDEALLGRVYSNMANMCRQANDHETAYEVYGMSAEHFRKTNDTLAYAYALNNMAWEQAVMGEKEEAYMLIDSAVRIYPYSPLIEKVIETKSAACLFRQEYDSVLYYTNGADNDYLLMLRAQAFSFLQIDDSAMLYAQQLLPRMTNLFYLDDLYYILTHNDTKADTETLRVLASERADVQNAIKERHGELTKAVQLLRQDLSKKEQATSWKAILWWVIGIGFWFGERLWCISNGSCKKRNRILSKREERSSRKIYDNCKKQRMSGMSWLGMILRPCACR